MVRPISDAFVVKDESAAVADWPRWIETIVFVHGDVISARHLACPIVVWANTVRISYIERLNKIFAHQVTPIIGAAKALERAVFQSDWLELGENRLAQFALRRAADDLASNDDSDCRESNNDERDAEPRLFPESVLHRLRAIKSILTVAITTKLLRLVDELKFFNGVAVLILLVVTLALPHPAAGHGFAGARFFPATLSTDDPFVNDELSLPTVSTIKTAEGRETAIAADIAKRITPNLGIELGEEFMDLNPNGENGVSGFGNLEFGAKYQFFTSAEHEAILSLGAEVEIGGTGQRRVDADSFSTWTPAFFFGKGLGDLADTLSLLRPAAVTGFVGVTIPSSGSTSNSEGEIERHPNVLQYGFALEYSLIYFQEQVKDVGLSAPFDRLIPLMEFSLETPLNRGESGQTMGTINPGVIWSSKYVQFGVEAIVPINERTGTSVGVIGQVHFYLDDLFPRSLGRPVFGYR